MARKADVAGLCRKIISDVRAGVFSPVYLLMGDEPYYPDLVCSEIMGHALADEERDFNQTVWYGLDTDADSIATEARSYPMMAERRLVVVKEMQNMRTSLEPLAQYCEDPLDSTVLVLLFHGKSVDKRTAFYKNILKKGVVVDSPAVRDYEMADWITGYYSSLGLRIDPDAASLLAESVGTDLSRVANETQKLLHNLPEDAKVVTAKDIEDNIGISREFSIFELTKALSYAEYPKALRIASYIGSAAKFVMPPAISAMFLHFSRLLRYEALQRRKGTLSTQEKTALLGNPYFFREYDTAAANWPMLRTMKVVSLLEEFDYRGKGGNGEETDPPELLRELVTRMVNTR